MKQKQLIVLLILVLVLGGAGIVVYRHNSSSWKARPASGKVLGDFSLNDVARIVIQTGSSSLTVAKKNDKWVVPASGDYPADFARVADFIQALWQLKTVQDMEAGPSQLSRFNLLPPGKGDGTGTLVELQGADSKPLASLLVGKKDTRKSPQAPPDEEGYAVGRYVMPAGSNPPKVSLVSETLDQVDPTPLAWLDKSFLKIDRIQSVTVASGTNQWALTRDSDAENEWKLAGAKPSEKVDQEKVPYFVSIFGSPTFNDVLPAGGIPAGYDSTVTVTTFDQFTYTLKFGKPAGDNLPLSIAVTANPPKERIPGKDEKPEDKKRLDDEFAANAKQLADRLAKDNALSSRIYLVPKTTFDALFVPRASLLAPPPSPTPAPAKTSPAPTPKKSPPPA